MTRFNQVYLRCRLLLACVGGAAICLASPSLARAQMAEDAEEAAKRVVVMVECSAADFDRPGAGLLVGMDADQVYVATAAHVVSKCAETDGARVRFRGGASGPIPARVVGVDAKPMDLAVLAVQRKAAFPDGQPVVALDRLGDPRLMRRGDPVYLMGNPRGIPWGVNAVADRLASTEGDVLLFASTFIGEGHSGGALLNDRGEIVGMIRSDQPPTGEAISIRRVIDRVSEWKFPVSLRPPLPRLVAGGDLTCRTSPDGSAGCWGDMDFGRGGIDPQTLKLPDARFKQIGLGIYHLCGLAFDGAVYCRGSNDLGQLGNGNTSSSYDDIVPVLQNSLVFASIAVGGFHSCALTQQGRAFCWGAGSQGKLGNNSNEKSLVPAPVAGGRTFTALAAGLRNTCGLSQEGEIFCWGGIGGTGLERYGTDPPIAWTPTQVRSTVRFKLVTSGEGHVCGLSTSGQAFCWGENERGELGAGRLSQRELEPVAVAGGHTFVSLAAGYGGDTCGITIEGFALCWGPNENGVHGNGGTKSSSVPAPVLGGLTWASISVGINHTCGVSLEGRVYCWGGIAIDGEGLGAANGSKVPTTPRNVP